MASTYTIRESKTRPIVLPGWTASVYLRTFKTKPASHFFLLYTIQPQGFSPLPSPQPRWLRGQRKELLPCRSGRLGWQNPARRVLAEEVVPRPVDQHQQAIAVAYQVEQVDGQP